MPAEPDSVLDVVVVGAGQAGLAMGHSLGSCNRRFLIVDGAGEVGSAWRGRWDSLTLFTPRRFSGLEGLPFPGDPDGYPDRDEVVEYLESYAERFDLPLALGNAVERITEEDGHFALELEDRALRARNVVVATGPFQTPYVPELASGLGPDTTQMHSTAYRRPAEVPGRKAAVVGGGNTGFQIAKELAASHEVFLSIGSRQKPLPQKLLGRDLFWWLTTSRILSATAGSRLGRRLRERETLIGSSTREVRRHGVELKPRAVSAAGRALRFEDDSEVDVDSVIWATGYRPEYSWVDLPVLDTKGWARHRRGVTDVPGFYFLGLTWQHTRGSALIGWVKDDAEFIAKQIDERQDGGP